MAESPAQDKDLPIAWCWVAAASHLTLALLVIATSWIGWSKSSSATRGVDGFFDWDFPAWVVDVLLVILYFSLVCSVEVKGSFDDRKYVFEAPSVRPEAWWVLWLMIMYGVWDFLTKCVPSKAMRKVGDKKKKSSGAHQNWFRRAVAWFVRSMKHFVACEFASLVSIGVALAIWFCVIPSVQSSTSPSCNPLEALAVDFALMALVVLFRIMKSFEGCPVLRSWRLPMASPAPDPEDYWKWKVVGLSVAIVTCCTGAAGEGGGGGWATQSGARNADGSRMGRSALAEGSSCADRSGSSNLTGLIGQNAHAPTTPVTTAVNTSGHRRTCGS
jgi:hypothetical protein